MKSGETPSKVILLLCVMTFLTFPAQALAKDGWYMGMDLGFTMAPEMDVAGRDNDVGTLCDKFINPDPFNPDTSTPIDCTRDGSEGDTWMNPVDGGTGILAGFSLGYRLGAFRGEGEYFYRTTTYDSRSNTRGLAPSIQRKVGEELEILDGGVDDVLSHNFFANLYYDFNTNSRFTPYVGVGVGVAQVSLDYFSRWKRHTDPEKITTFNRNDASTMCEPGETRQMLCQTLAGTTTIADRKLTDTLFGYQLLAGMDYQISDPISIGLKFRWADFGEFEGGAEWDQLRSHDSHNGDDVRVRYKVMTDDIQFWGVSLNMKYAFDQNVLSSSQAGVGTGLSNVADSSRTGSAKDGWYMGMDLGFAKAPDLKVDGGDNDVATTCDEFFVGGYDKIPRPSKDCNPSSPSSFWNEVDGGTGILAGAALGYRLGDFRLEGEYFYRTTTYDGRSNTQGLDPITERKRGQELEILDGGVDDVLSHNFFANLYYDFNTDSRFTPYVGAGVGVAQVSMDFFSRWQRNGDPEKIETFNDFNDNQLTQGEKDRLHRRLAGTTTIADRKLTDTLFGYQILAGVDYRVSDPVSIGLKFRWADFGEFKDEAEWDQLRSHDSARAPGRTRVRYFVMTDDIQFWGLSLNMKYAF